MIWDRAAPFYDLFENLYNKKVNTRLCAAVASYINGSDYVLECACGTGMLTLPIAAKCKKLLAADYSAGMLKQAMKKCAGTNNIKFAKANILSLPYKNDYFDKVVAANVIHLLADPAKALRELERVCKPGGKTIIPTYINGSKSSAGAAAELLERFGIKFSREFSYESYRQFFSEQGHSDAEFILIDGRMPCAIAIITKNNS